MSRHLLTSMLRCGALGLMSLPLMAACQKHPNTPTQPASPQAESGDLSAAPATPPAPEPSELERLTRDIPGQGALFVTLTTTKGELSCHLFEAEAPITVANFVGLATGQLPWRDPATQELVEGKPFFDNLPFSRVIPDFLIQSGDPTGDGTGSPGYTIPDELSPTLRHDRAGILSMANAGPNTGGSQFFILERPAPHLDGRHTIFGECAPIEVIRAISRTPADAQDRPVDPPPRIEAITFIRKPLTSFTNQQ